MEANRIAQGQLDLAYSRILIRELAQECRAEGRHFAKADRSSFRRACGFINAERGRSPLFSLACQFEKRCASLFIDEANAI